jgi:hypothetical protein
MLGLFYFGGEMLTIKLDGIDAAACEVVASHEGISPEHLVKDLVREAAIYLVTSKSRRGLLARTQIKRLPAEDPKQEQGAKHVTA